MSRRVQSSSVLEQNLATVVLPVDASRVPCSGTCALCSKRSVYFSTAAATVTSADDAKKDVLIALSQIIDPDFGTDIVSCGFVKDLEISDALDKVVN